MNKLEQRLIDLTKQLASARITKNEDLIADLEDKIDEVEYQLEESYNRHYTDSEEY